MNQLVVLEQIKPLELFTPQGVDDILDRIAKEARAHFLDISTPDGREQIKSLAYKIARSKTALDDMGKELVSDWKEKSKLVDNERKRIRDALDALKEEIRAPLTEWESREKARVNAHEEAIAKMASLGAAASTISTPSALQKLIEGLADLYAREWQEFDKRADLVRETAARQLADALAAATKREAEETEMARLRAEEAQRKQWEHEERLKAEAAEAARKEAEEKAKKEAEAEAARVKAEQEKAEQERLRIEREKEEEARKAREAEERARKAEEERLAAIAQAEADKKAAEEKAERDRIEAEDRAKREAEAAVKAERERVEAEQKAEADAAAKREADKQHRAKVNREAMNAILALPKMEQVDIAPEIAKGVVEAIAKGLIPHVKISY